MAGLQGWGDILLSVIRREGDEITFSKPDLKGGGDTIKTRLITLIRKETNKSRSLSVYTVYFRPEIFFFLLFT